MFHSLPLAAAEAERRPRLVIEEPVLEAGDLKPGAEFRAEFKLRNLGDADLILTDARTGCDCAAVEYDRLVPPGGEGRVSLTLQIYKEWAGREVRRAVWLSANDPDALEVRLILRGRAADLDSQ